MDLPAGSSTFQIKGVSKDWKGGPGIRRLWLTPAPQ